MVLIRPEVGMYAAFARLNYKPWYALAEFVDNSLQSALANIDALRAAEGADYRLRVEIDVSDESIEIRDNAAGIAGADYDRSFLPAALPDDTSGLSEFGLGMKAAATWFAERWAVRTSALSEPIERTISFDIPSIVRTNCENLDPVLRSVSSESHFTTVTLGDLQVRPRGGTIKKIKDHLIGMYRVFLREGLLELRFCGEPLIYAEPEFLKAPYHSTPNGPSVVWRKDINLELDDGHCIRGWAGILARASVPNAGFALFRRGRVVQGSHGDGYRPASIFGSQNKFVYQRLVGELEVVGFSVTHTKDGIQWREWDEDDILSWLKDALDAEPLPLLDQAKHFRVRSQPNRDAVGEATLDTSLVIAQHLPPVIDSQIGGEPNVDPLAHKLDRADEDTTRREQVELNLDHAHRRWNVTVELVSDASRDAWYELAEGEVENDMTPVQIRVNLAHPFMLRFVEPDGAELVPFTRLAAGLAVAEITARQVGVREAGTIRMNLNQILRSALSGPVRIEELPND